MNWNRLLPGTIRSVLRGQAPIIRSDGSFKRDYVYVEDAVQAYLILAEWAGRMQARYLMVSLPPTFAYPGTDDCARRHCADRRLSRRRRMSCSNCWP